MIDTHCHLEQSGYDKDRESLIEGWRGKLKAVVTSCVNPKYFDITMQIVKKYRNFVFATASVHPEYVKKLRAREIREYIELIASKRKSVVAIGETGLDYHWVKETKWREKQKRLFTRFIELAKQLQLPLVIHSRDSVKEVIEILRQRAVKRVQMHMFTEHKILKQVVDNGWLVSVNTLLIKSKKVKKVVRDCPLEQLMLETDSPWLGVDRDGNITSKAEIRNEPTAVRLVAEKVAEVKKIELESVVQQTTDNAINFFKLNLK